MRNSFEIIFNSNADSGPGNIGNRVAINLEDVVGYTLVPPTLHEVVINQRPSSAEFVEAESDVRSNGGQVLIPVRLANAVHALAQPVTISWSFANGAAFSTNATCFNSSGDTIADIAAATEGNCESVVDRGSQEAVITVNSNVGSSATDDNLILTIGEGGRYVVGATDEHRVALFDAPEASFDAAESTLEHGDGTTGGERLVQLNLAGTGLPAYRIQWEFDASRADHPFEFNCTPVGGVAVTRIASGTQTGRCESVVAAGDDNSVNIVINSAVASAAANIGDALTLSIVASEEYTRGTIEHQVDIVAIVVQPDADFAEARSEVQAEGGRIEIPVNILPAAQAGGIDVVWTYNAGANPNPHPFIPVCLDALGVEVQLAQSATCQTNVPAGDNSFNIIVSSTDDSVADEGTLDLVISEGTGYAVGTTQSDHVVRVIAPPDVSFAEVGPSSVPYGVGNEVQIRVNLAEVPAGETLDVQWSWLTGFAAGTPQCTSSVVVGLNTICTTTVPANANFFNIRFITADTSSVDNVGDRLAINLEDVVGYTLIQPISHDVVINQTASAADFVTGESEVRADGGRVLITVSLAVQVDADAQPVTIRWRFDDDELVFDPVCFRGGTSRTTDDISGTCESVVAAGQQQTTITVDSTDGSNAGDGGVLDLEIRNGNGYVLGTRLEHQVTMFNTPEASFAAADSDLEHDDGTTPREQVEVQLNLAGTELPAYRIQWRFDASRTNHPFEFNCTPVGGVVAVSITIGMQRGVCESVVAAGDSSVNIIINSAAASAAANIGDALTLSIIASDEYNHPAATDDHRVVIVSPPAVGFTAGTADDVFWGQDNLVMSVVLSPPLSANAAGNLSLNFRADDFNINWVTEVDDNNVLACAETSCDLTNPDETVSPIEATVQFTQNAADTPGPRAVTVLLSDAYLDAVNDAVPDDRDYIFGNRRLVVSVINPVISRTTSEAIEVNEGESVDVIFTRAPIIGDGDNFAVGVGFENGAEAADIGAIAVNETACTLTPPITCRGNFGSNIGGLVVSISIAADFELGEANESIVLNLLTQNGHDVNPAAGLLATVTIANVNPQIADIRVLGASASPSQVKGYLATISIELTAPAAADTTGDLTIAFTTDGILNDEVVPVTGAGDFTCTERTDPQDDICTHTFESGDENAESLALVLSLAIGGDVDTVPMEFSGTASGYVVTESNINLTRTNYTVAFANADPIADITEDEAVDAFNLAVTPALANDITIAFRLTAAAAPANALNDEEDVIFRRTTGNAVMDCTPDTSDAARQILDCDLIALGDSGIVAADPTGTSSTHEFSIGAVNDSEVDGIAVQATLIASVGYDIPDPGTNTDAFDIIDAALPAAGEVAFNTGQQTTTGEAFFTGYWGTINRRQSFLVPLRISPSYPASGTSPTLVVTSIGRTYGAAFTVPTRLNGISSDCGGLITCDRRIVNYVRARAADRDEEEEDRNADGDIVAFNLPVFIQRSGAGQTVTLVIVLTTLILRPMGLTKLPLPPPSSLAFSPRIYRWGGSTLRKAATKATSSVFKSFRLMN